MLSPTYEITTALSHTDELISHPYDIAIVTISYGRVTMSSVWDSMMSKKNMGWPFYAAVWNNTQSQHHAKIYMIDLKLKDERKHHTLCYFSQHSLFWCTIYPKKYAHGFCFAVLCCGYTLTDFPISIRLTSLALWQSSDCPSTSKATLMNMDEYFMWIHYERLHNHNKAKHNTTVCIFLGIYCNLRLLPQCSLKYKENGNLRYHQTSHSGSDGLW